ncbi:hypothetical protein LZ554_007254 [Drepanopeziza brunnea f. sp. 'monogermtubi']|nr:hypothetical protein LZ554_007254 [Drepanopeziza brunnea f. sp. 'monogermtubi']
MSKGKFETSSRALGNFLKVAVAAASWSSKRLDIFRTGDRASDLQHKYWDGNKWGGFESTRRRSYERSNCCSMGPESPRCGGMAALGVAGNRKAASSSLHWTSAAGTRTASISSASVLTMNAAFHKSGDGSRWSAYESLGDIFTSPVKSVSGEAERLDLFGLGTDSSSYHKFWDGTRWSDGWENLGGVFTTPLAAESSGARDHSEARDIAVVGRGTDSALWINQRSGSWTGWQSLGGIFISEPSIVSWGPGRYDLFGIGIDGAMYHKYYANGSWSASWENLGGVLISAPTAVSWGANRLDIFALGTDDAVWHKWWDGSAWGGWERLG